MATVTSQLTRIHDVEGALTLTTIGGGAGGGANTEIFIQGAQSAGRKQSNAVDHGFWLAVTTRDISGTGVHVGIWANHIHYAVLSKLAFRLGSTTANYHEHYFPLTAYPTGGGWVRSWINVGRTPDATFGTFNKADLTQVAILASLPAVGGNAPNLIMDASDFATGGLLLTGTAGIWQDFLSADEGSGTNKYGVVTSKDGVIYCLARLTLGSASSLVFSDSDFVIVFPNQSLVASNFMGITVDLQNVSTAITWTSAVVRSAGVRQGDLVVAGTAGSFSADGCSFGNLRVVTLTAAVTLDACTISGSGLIAANGAVVTDCAVSGATGTAALLWDTATNTDSKLDGTSFVMGPGEHGLELGSNTPVEITLRDVAFSGYGADGVPSAALYNNSGKAVTVNIVGGTTPTVRNGTGASTTLVANPVTTLVTVKDINTGSVISGARVLVTASDNTGPMPFEETVTITRADSTATVTHTGHGLVNGKKVLIKGADQQEYNGIFVLTVVDPNTYTYTVSGAPATPATGTIKATGVVIDDVTNAGGQISDVRPHASNQPITGRVRKATGGTLYKTGSISGTVNNASGFSVTVQMITDA